MSDIFREVEEDIRKDHWRRLWDRFAPYILGGAVLIVLATAGYRGWEYWQIRQADASGDRFLAALQLSEEGKYQEAIPALRALAEDGSGSYPLLARFRLATDLARSGDVVGAVAEYDAIAGSNAPDDVRALARLRAALLLVDTAPPSELETRLHDLADTGNAWRHTAREILAISAWRSGDLTNAKRYLDMMTADQETPQDIRGRVVMLSSLVDARLAGTGSAPTEVAPAN
jgi:hypothetical protein